MSDLCGHLFGGARRTVVLVRGGFGVRGGGAGGLGAAGKEALGQCDGALVGACYAPFSPDSQQSSQAKDQQAAHRQGSAVGILWEKMD